jgi:predicted secreted Zn-dependent protease
MYADRKARLDELGFVWDALVAQLEEGFAQLQTFVKDHGHCRVPNTYVTGGDGYQLGRWVQRQRTQRAGMPADREARLDALGFIWDPLATRWEEGFAQLQTFVRENGHCRVPNTYVTADGYQLGQWVGVQRAAEESMSADRKARLDELGFVWDALATQWEQGFEQLQTFVRENGHCRVPNTYVTTDGLKLGQWVGVQRQNKDRLGADRKARLDELGFAWDPFLEQWEESFAYLEAFVREHGHCRVPPTHVTADGYRLAGWVQTQRRQRDRMPADRKARLDELGFVWDVFDTQWEEGFAQLQTFVREHGHCRIPQKHVTADGHRLGSWVSNQRAAEDSMSADRKARLDALGFVWRYRPRKRVLRPRAIAQTGAE